MANTHTRKHRPWPPQREELDSATAVVPRLPRNRELEGWRGGVIQQRCDTAAAAAERIFQIVGFPLSGAARRRGKQSREKESARATFGRPEHAPRSPVGAQILNRDEHAARPPLANPGRDRQKIPVASRREIYEIIAIALKKHVSYMYIQHVGTGL